MTEIKKTDYLEIIQLLQQDTDLKVMLEEERKIRISAEFQKCNKICLDIVS